MVYDLSEAVYKTNIADELSKEKLSEIGDMLLRDINLDISSRQNWESNIDDYMELAKQVMRAKSYPWPNASNVKFPVLSLASIQFHARTFPELLGKSDVVKTRRVGGQDTDITDRSERVGRFMSVQCTELMEEWLDEMDRLFIILPILGMAYKKTFYDSNQGIQSILVHPRDLIVNYHADNFKVATKTHRLFRTSNEVHEMQADGTYLQVDLGRAPDTEFPGTRDESQGLNPSGDAPHELYESHCWYDLDDDGYKEPYIITLEKSTGKVLRIVARWETPLDVEYNQNESVVRIKPEEYFTVFKFLPDPDSAIYGLGFGQLIGPTNEAANTIINQLLDAGHLANLSSGFIGRGARMNRGGVIKFKPGEWHKLQTTGDDLRKSIVPLPAPEPSMVLFQLLGLLVESARDLTSVQDLMQGKSPGQNQPHATSMQVLEQGLKVFNTIYKRAYRSLKREYKKIYVLNYKYLGFEEYQEILDTDAFPDKDFTRDNTDVIPAADPDMVAEIQKITRALSLEASVAAGAPINKNEVLIRKLRAEGHENIEALMNVPEPQPSFEMQMEMRKQDFAEQKFGMEHELNTLKVTEQAMRDRAAAYKTIKDVELEQDKISVEQYKAFFDALHARRDEIIREMDAVTKRITANKPAAPASKD